MGFSRRKSKFYGDQAFLYEEFIFCLYRSRNHADMMSCTEKDKEEQFQTFRLLPPKGANASSASRLVRAEWIYHRTCQNETSNVLKLRNFINLKRKKNWEDQMQKITLSAKNFKSTTSKSDRAIFRLLEDSDREEPEWWPFRQFAKHQQDQGHPVFESR